MEHLVNLEELYLNGNQIKEIEDLDNLTNLEVLDLSYNEITKSKALDKLANLKKLELKCAQKPLAIAEKRQSFEHRKQKDFRSRDYKCVCECLCFILVWIIVGLVFLFMINK